MFFDVFQALCQKNGVSCKRAVEEIGLSNSIATKWKKTGATPQGETLERIADYFRVSTDYLLGKEDKGTPTVSGRRSSNCQNVSERNIIRIVGRDGSYEERVLSDEHLAALKVILSQLPDASGNL